MLVIDGRTRVGVTVAQIATAFLSREFGDDAFGIRRVRPNDSPPQRTARSLDEIVR